MQNSKTQKDQDLIPNNSSKETLEGVLFLYSETGTEGGFWAFQDSCFIYQNKTRYSCKKCHLYWDKDKDPLRHPVFEKQTSDNWPDFCSSDDHQFELVSQESWSYEGLHCIKDGDHLTIYLPDTKNEVWSGVIQLKQHNLFTEDARGFWIHADQVGIERDVWAKYFFNEYPAKLVLSKQPQ